MAVITFGLFRVKKWNWLTPVFHQVAAKLNGNINTFFFHIRGIAAVTFHAFFYRPGDRGPAQRSKLFYLGYVG
jgi:hypothetical protein